jgi:hypothetical protein
MSGFVIEIHPGKSPIVVSLGEKKLEEHFLSVIGETSPMPGEHLLPYCNMYYNSGGDFGVDWDDRKQTQDAFFAAGFEHNHIASVLERIAWKAEYDESRDDLDVFGPAVIVFVYEGDEPFSKHGAESVLKTIGGLLMEHMTD